MAVLAPCAAVTAQEKALLAALARCVRAVGGRWVFSWRLVVLVVQRGPLGVGRGGVAVGGALLPESGLPAARTARCFDAQPGAISEQPCGVFFARGGGAGVQRRGAEATCGVRVAVRWELKTVQGGSSCLAELKTKSKKLAKRVARG